MEKIKRKILLLINSLSASYNSDDHSLESLELKMLSTEELIQTGFVDNNIKIILNPEDKETMKHVHEFFDAQCKNVMPDEIDPIYSPPEPMSMGDYIDYFKYSVVRGVVKNKIIKYIDDIKKKDNINNDSDDDMPF